MSSSDETSERLFPKAPVLTKRFRQSLININANLKSLGLSEISSNGGKGSIEAMFQRNPQGLGACGEIENAIRNSLNLVNEIETYINDYTRHWHVEQIKAEDVRRAERRAAWVIWYQKVVRWTLGVAVAVGLYSLLVWLTNTFDFIHIPIRDLAINCSISD